MREWGTVGSLTTGHRAAVTRPDGRSFFTSICSYLRCRRREPVRRQNRLAEGFTAPDFRGGFRSYEGSSPNQHGRFLTFGPCSPIFGSCSPISGRFSGLAEAYPEIPGPFPEIAEPFSGLAEPFPGLAEPFPEIPEPFLEVPEPFPGIPEPFSPILLSRSPIFLEPSPFATSYFQVGYMEFLLYD